jgi:catechol 2,3-dioxygenase-like lactoylglutathione lyase family enzyme
MQVKGLVWIGIPTERYQDMVSFFTSMLGLEVEFDEAGTIELSAANGDRIQLLDPSHGYYKFFRQAGATIVPLFEVDELPRTKELKSAGFEIIGPADSDANWSWIHVRAPDGSLYALGART